MTKKRFVKLLMSHGVQRNEANERAAYSNSRNVPYARAYPIARLSVSICKFSKAVQQVAPLIVKLAYSTKGFAELTKERMKEYELNK